MKKYNSKNLVFISLLITSLIMSIFSSCDGIVFHDIRKEVKLADAEIGGDIANIIRYQLDGIEHIFVSNGTIHTRSVNADENLGDVVIDSKISWSDFSTPGDYVYSLAADSSNLYAASITIEKDDDGYNVATSRAIYCYDSSEKSWTVIYSDTYSESVSLALLCTNTPQPANRKAYLRTAKTITVTSDGEETSTTVPVVYELNGTQTILDDEGAENISAKYLYKTTDSSTSTSYPVGELSDTAPTTTSEISSSLLSASSCASFGGTIYFSSSNSMITNETADDEATLLYYSAGDNVYYKGTVTTTTTDNDGNTTSSKTYVDWNSVDLNCDTIYTMAVTANYLLAGTSDGIVHTPLTGGVPAAGTADFSTNADSTLSSYYEVQYILVIDPSLEEYSATIYATSETSSTSASLNNVGLWSYYASEGEWNRE